MITFSGGRLAQNCKRYAFGALIVLSLPSFAQNEIVVGALLPITGNFAASGIQYYNSLKLAQDDINTAGGINGRKLRIVFEDTQANNSVAVNAFIKVVKQNDPPFVFLPSLSTQVLAMEAEVAKAKIPAIYGGGAVAIQDRKNPYMFRARPADSLQAGVMAFGIGEILKKNRPGLLYAQDDYGTGAAKALESNLAERGIPIVAKESFNPRDNDFSAQLLSLKNKGVDVIALISYNRDGALILKQRRTLGLDMPLVGGSAMAAPSTLDLVDAEDLKGVYSMADTILGDGVSAASREFVARYVKAFKLNPDPYGAAYYDAAMILAEGLRKVGPDREKLRGFLGALNGFKGVARTYTVDPSTNNLAHTVMLVGYKAGSKEFTGLATYPK